MTTTTQKRIEQAYFACERLCAKHGADRWLDQARDKATEQEHRHRAAGRRFTNGQAGYRMPASAAGRWFAVRWFLDVSFEAPRSYADAAKLREDALLGLAARDAVRKADAAAWGTLRAAHADVADLDYCATFTT